MQTKSTCSEASDIAQRMTASSPSVKPPFLFLPPMSPPACGPALPSVPLPWWILVSGRNYRRREVGASRSGTRNDSNAAGKPPAGWPEGRAAGRRHSGATAPRPASPTRELESLIRNPSPANSTPVRSQPRTRNNLVLLQDSGNR